MMYDVDIYATFYNNLCFVRSRPSNFCMYVVGTKMSFKICVHAMESPTTCHNFWTCIKTRITCMCLLVAIFFRSTIQIGHHAFIWWGMCLNAHVPGGVTYTIAYIFLCHFVYISMPTSRSFQQLSCWISIYAYNYGFLRSKLNVLRSNMDIRPPLNRMPNFYEVYNIA
jgi:hypothetical protein